MKLINLKQGTPEWLEWRKKGVTASEAASILGLSPWETKSKLWERKSGLSDFQASNEAMRYGQQYEDEARQKFEELHNQDVYPCCLESTEHPVIRASLDGMSVDGHVVEIKVPGKKTMDLAMLGIVPDNYNAQMQCQMYVAETDTAHYFVYDPKGHYAQVIVKRDDEFIQKMICEMLEFWEMVVKGIAPNKKERK